MSEQEKRFDLKPCPFCGGAAEIRTALHGYKSDDVYKQLNIRCSKCGIVQPSYVTVKFVYDPQTGAVADEADLFDAIDAWNRRV